MDIEKYEEIAETISETGASVFPVPTLGQDVAYGAVEPVPEGRTYARVQAMNVLSNLGMSIVGLDKKAIYFEDPAVTRGTS